MNTAESAAPAVRVTGSDRRELVLESALVTFARFGYRKTSMDEIARAANISRPGLYLYFRSKDEVFRAAVAQALERDIAAAEEALGETGPPLSDRLVAAFDHWTGRYLGAISRDIASVIDDNPALLGDLVVEYPDRFAQLVTAAIGAHFIARDATAPSSPAAHTTAVAQTLISAAIGIKQQVDDRDAFAERLSVAIGVIVR